MKNKPFVLYIDDDACARQTFRTAFNVEFSILTAANPDRAFDLTLSECRTCDPALILTEAHIRLDPKSQQADFQGGLKAVKDLERIFTNSPIVGYSSVASPLEVLHFFAVSSNVCGFFLKPQTGAKPPSSASVLEREKRRLSGLLWLFIGLSPSEERFKKLREAARLLRTEVEYFVSQARVADLGPYTKGSL